MSSSVFHLGYISHAAPEMSADMVRQIRAISARRNRERNITGFLLHTSGHFIQLLEGDEATVQMTYDIIKADPRHRKVHTIIEKPVGRRLFGRWDMQVDELAADSFARFIGVDATLLRTNPCSAIVTPEHMYRLVMSAYLSHELNMPPWTHLDPGIRSDGPRLSEVISA